MTSLHSNGFTEIEANPEFDPFTADLFNELSHCRLCPRECGVNRLRGELGFCGAPLPAEVFYHGLLVNEEGDLNPAYEVFFTGCNLSCKFCYLHRKWSARGVPLHHSDLLADPGLEHARTISVVGGEPAVNLAGALTLFGSSGVRPRVWNSNMYYGSLVADIVNQVADVVVADIHFGNDVCAAAIAGASDYLGTVGSNIERAIRGGREVIVRHLLLPGHFDCCALPAARLAAERFPGARFHALANYLPPEPARAGQCVELLGRPPALDARRLMEEAAGLGLRVERGADIYGRETRRTVCREEGEIVIGADGRVTVPHLTPGLLEVITDIWEGKHE